MRIETGNSRTRSLLALCVVLTLIIVAQWLLPIGDEAFTELQADATDGGLPVRTSSAYVHPHIEDFAAILERPVFFKDRSLPPPPAAAPVAAPEPLRLRLEGVAIVADSKVAVLRNLADNQLLQLAEGMSHNDWNLESVTADSATFKRGEEVAKLSLDPATGRGTRR
jgi:hypothetical protein